jgi:poly(3-hydroxybutyrate) depolymerase
LKEVMLYQLYESQRALLSPMAGFAQAAAKMYASTVPGAPALPFSDRFAAGFDLTHRLLKDYEKPEFGINAISIGGKDVVVQQQTAAELPFCKLLRFKRFTDDEKMLTAIRSQPSVLVVAPLSGHHSTLLRETVRELLKDHKVYITDWIDARMVPLASGAFTLDDYVHYVQQFIRKIQEAEVELHVISVCQPTVPVLAAISLMASAGEKLPKTMTMMGGPIDARKSPTSVNNLATNKTHEWFERNVIYRVPGNYPGSGRRVYPGFMQHSGFVAMNPDRHMSSHYEYFLDLVKGDKQDVEQHRSFYDEYNAVLDMPAEYYLDTIKTVFQDFSLVNGTWTVAGKLVKPGDIKGVSLLTVEGELDDISGAGQTQAAHGLCTGIADADKKHYTAPKCGHYGIFSGKRWRDNIYPQVRDFIASNAVAAPVAAVVLASVAAPVVALASEPVATTIAAKTPAKKAAKNVKAA